MEGNRQAHVHDHHRGRAGLRHRLGQVLRPPSGCRSPALLWAVAAEHALIHTVPRLTAATVHTDHTPAGGDPHAALAHHGGG